MVRDDVPQPVVSFFVLAAVHVLCSPVFRYHVLVFFLEMSYGESITIIIIIIIIIILMSKTVGTAAVPADPLCCCCRS